MATEGTFVLADIGGYTQFLTGVGIEHAKEITSDLFNAMLKCNRERWAALWSRRADARPSGRQPQTSSQRTEVQALSLGEGLAVLALPGEFFVETADVIRAAADTTDVFIACYANDYVGYVIPADAYEQGGYESGITFCPPEAEAIIVSTSLSLLKEVGGGKA